MSLRITPVRHDPGGNAGVSQPGDQGGIALFWTEALQNPDPSLASAFKEPVLEVDIQGTSELSSDEIQAIANSV